MKFDAKKQVQINQYNSLKNINIINMYNLFCEIKDIHRLLPNGGEILHVGIGTDMLTPILKNFNYKVSTMDIIDELNPDFVGSLHELDKVVENKKFDLIVCSHILEHIPYNLFETCLEQIQRHSRYSLIYLPDSGIAFGAELRILPKWRKIFTLFLPIFKFKKIHFNGEHYWELDLKETPRKKVINDISQYFKIIKKYRNQHWDNSYNFILESK